ncbi:LamG-like jellyroll fold domain-containing protein [Acidovorax sp. SUPP3334]|uniref:LamG-like jellyroll fold domain-containing protein n=1 Tax=Acidovorax sp. SUPP3334 TaxID=2920881 RepID=UPI0023DE40E9|nr:LamG-like jellyroll fold domain-containing protein [Acidovorax sp. SUPP3334]GKT22517.1 LamG domain-containing protein [Acidovorax sp. SUPP3334]
MAAARYWRLVAVRPWGLGALSISEVALYTGAGRADLSATLTSRMAPVAGALAALQDGSATAAVTWDAAQVAAPGWALVWDFGSAVDILYLAIGAGSDQARYPCDLRLESSTDGRAWSVLGEVSGLLFPGAHTLGSVDDLRQHVFAMDFNGPAITDAYGHAITTFGGAHIESTAPLQDGTPYLVLSGGDDYLEIANSPDLHLGNEYEIGFDLFIPSAAGEVLGAIWHHGFYDTNSLSWTSPGLSIRVLPGYLRFYFWVQTNPTDQFVDATYTADVAQRWRMVRAGTNGAIYRDGVQVASRSGLGTLPAPTRPLQIGRWAFSAGTPTLNAKVDNLYADSGVRIARAGALRAVPVLGSRAQLLTASPVPAFRAGAPAAAAIARDMEFGGAGRIWGTTKTKGVTNLPTRSRVVLLRQRDKLVARETWSDAATGAFEFTDIDMAHQWLVLAEDQAGNYRPVAANRLEAQP